MTADLRQKVELMLDEAAARYPEGVKSDELRRIILPDVRLLLASTERDLDTEAEALCVSVGQKSRRSRRDGMSKALDYILDAFAENEDGAYIDPMLDLAYPVGTDDGMVKTLRNWTVEDFDTSTRMAYRKAAEVTAAARDHDEALSRAVNSMRLRGSSRFGARSDD